MNNYVKQEERLAKLRGDIQQLQTMVDSDGWKQVASFFQAVRIQRRNAIFSHDASGLDAAIQMAQIKSELAGMEFIMAAPDTLLEDLKLEEQALLEEMKDELVD